MEFINIETSAQEAGALNANDNLVELTLAQLAGVGGGSGEVGLG